MLFILVMDILNSVFNKACEIGLLSPLSCRNPGQQISLYADDVAIFIRPVQEEMNLTIRIFEKLVKHQDLEPICKKLCYSY